MSTKPLTNGSRQWFASVYAGKNPDRGERATDPWCLALARWVTTPPRKSEERSRRERAAAAEARNRRCRGDLPDGVGLSPSERAEVEALARGEGPPGGSPEARLRQAAQARRSPPPAPPPRRERDEREEQAARIRRATAYAIQHPRR